MDDCPRAPGTGGAPHIRSPFRLGLDQQRKRAKELRRALIAGEAAAAARFVRWHPAAAAASPDDLAARFGALAEAQLVVARELGLPSWPKLKAHILAMTRAREAIGDAADAVDGDVPTLHVRCGSDIRLGLRQAGLSGDFLEVSDPLVQGPVVAGADWLERRAAFLAEAYGVTTGRSLAGIRNDLAAADEALRGAAGTYERVVLWFEHDSYDQLLLARCLALFADLMPRRLELVSVDRYPGSVRFIGLGQLPPEALYLLWRERQPVPDVALAAGRSVWQALRASDPTDLAAAAAHTDIAGLPHMGAALLRHCRELPWLEDGLGLTERLVLQSIATRPRTVGEIFRDLMMEREPLPWLGDLMFLFIVESMKRTVRPVFTGSFDTEQHHWPHERLTITDLGRSVLEGEVDWLSLEPPERWVGGVRVSADAEPCWRWDEKGCRVVLR